jgi:chromosome segregation ATPase
VKGQSKEHRSRSQPDHSQAVAEIKVLKEEKYHLQSIIQKLTSDRDQLYREKKVAEEERSDAVRKSFVELQSTKDEKEKLRQVLVKCSQDHVELKDKVSIMDIQVRIWHDCQL